MYEMHVYNHTSDEEVMVIENIALSRVEKKGLENILRQCKNSKFGFPIKKSKEVRVNLPSVLLRGLTEILKMLQETEIPVKSSVKKRLDLEGAVRQNGFYCYASTWREDYTSRVFIKVTNVPEINEVMSIVTQDFQELSKSDFHIGNNCLWIYEDALYSLTHFSSFCCSQTCRPVPSRSEPPVPLMRSTSWTV